MNAAFVAHHAAERLRQLARHRAGDQREAGDDILQRVLVYMEQVSRRKFD